MKVIYESVERTVIKAIKEAADNNRRIERIELEWWEARELRAALHDVYTIAVAPTGYSSKDVGSRIGTYMGVDLYIV